MIGIKLIVWHLRFHEMEDGLIKIEAIQESNGKVKGCMYIKEDGIYYDFGLNLPNYIQTFVTENIRTFRRLLSK